MKVITSIGEMQDYSIQVKLEGKAIGFVPTMGALHEGHLSLVRLARNSADIVVVSIFVNPIQFGVGEDFNRYPRTMQEDLAACTREGVDVVFAPTSRDMYPSPFLTYVDVEKITERLCGRSRSGHFKGVATVVTKLFNIVMPDKAFFGQKDAQQQGDKADGKGFEHEKEIVEGETIREHDGLAVSSRNKYLSLEERQSATCLYRALVHAKDLIAKGERDSARIIESLREIIEKESTAQIDYIDISDSETLDEKKEVQGKVLIALAVKIGNTRLIDNMVVDAEG